MDPCYTANINVKFQNIMQYKWSFLPQYIATLAYCQNICWSNRWQYKGVLLFICI